jgi:hypothetical protein
MRYPSGGPWSGWQQNEHRRCGLGTGTGPERFDQLDETCAAVPGLAVLDRLQREVLEGRV